MPLDKNHCNKFYYGTGAEFYLMSMFYFMGYEAQKLTPDAGCDFVVTNFAKRKFTKCERKELYVQVKSTIMVKSCDSNTYQAIYFLDKEELETLISDESMITVFCYGRPIIEPDPCTFNYDPFIQWQESDEASWTNHMYENIYEFGGRSKLYDICTKGFDLRYIWLNNKQLSKAKDQVFHDSQKDPKYKIFILEICEDGVKVIPPDNTDICGWLIKECRNIYYMLNRSGSETSIKDGKFLLEHI